MAPYIVLISICFLLHLIVIRSSVKTRVFAVRLNYLLVFVFGAFRYAIGADWGNYSRIFEAIDEKFWQRGDFIFYGFLYIVKYIGGNYLVATILLTLIYMYLMYQMSQNYFHKSLVLLYYLPWFIIVFYFGYIRQGIAAMTLVLIATRSKKGFLLYIIPSLIHYSAFPMSLWVNKRLLVGLVFLVGVSFLELNIDTKVFNLESTGFVQRLFVVGVSTILMLFGVKSSRSELLRTLYLLFILLLAYTLNYSDTMLDRYLVYVFGILGIYIMECKRGHRNLILLVQYSSFFIWLVTSNNTWAWLPYKSYLIR